MMNHNKVNYFSLVMLYVASLVVSAIAIVMLSPFGFDLTFTAITSQVVGQVVCIYLFIKLDKSNIVNGYNMFIKDWRKSVITLLGLYVGAVAFTVIVTPAINETIVAIAQLFDNTAALPESSENQSTIVDILGSADMITLVMMITLITVVAPIFEELIFRRALIGLFANYLKVKWLGYVLSVLSFAFIHVAFAGDVLAVGPYLVSGTAFALIYWYKQENIIYPIIVHMIWNIVVTIIVFN